MALLTDGALACAGAGLMPSAYEPCGLVREVLRGGDALVYSDTGGLRRVANYVEASGRGAISSSAHIRSSTRCSRLRLYADRDHYAALRIAHDAACDVGGATWEVELHRLCACLQLRQSDLLCGEEAIFPRSRRTSGGAVYGEILYYVSTLMNLRLFLLSTLVQFVGALHRAGLDVIAELLERDAQVRWPLPRDLRELLLAPVTTLAAAWPVSNLSRTRPSGRPRAVRIVLLHLRPASMRASRLPLSTRAPFACNCTCFGLDRVDHADRRLFPPGAWPRGRHNLLVLFSGAARATSPRSACSSRGAHRFRPRERIEGLGWRRARQLELVRVARRVLGVLVQADAVLLPARGIRCALWLHDAEGSVALRCHLPVLRNEGGHTDEDETLLSRGLNSARLRRHHAVTSATTKQRSGALVVEYHDYLDTMTRVELLVVGYSRFTGVLTLPAFCKA